MTIAGKDVSMDESIKHAITSKAAPTVHAVIADEVIRQKISRREYRRVVARSYNKIRDAIGWTDTKGAQFCPKWRTMKKMCLKEMAKGPNKGLHTKKPD